jgi:hypothetical protein
LSLRGNEPQIHQGQFCIIGTGGSASSEAGGSEYASLVRTMLVGVQ